jgi:molybdopterin-guanine dinucleotide biosynthesis protein A
VTERTVPEAAAAILLAGGRGSRMGGAVKPLLELDGQSLLHRAIDAVSGCSPVTIAAEVLDETVTGVDWVREQPPFSGPAAAVVAVLGAWRARDEKPGWALLLACDLPHPDVAVASLTAASAEPGAPRDGWCLVDAEGRPQWLAGLYRTAALHEAAATLPDAGRDASLRALLGGLAIERVPATAAAVADIDTWNDLEQARSRVTEEKP